ncbi:MAG: NAD(P)H-dependent oxidoreductase [Acidisphaera sp.]|nr:NAD(P)H-dependent oxidoreductase [Acidisphaera sp.]
MSDSAIRLLGISGSLRRDSYSTAVLRTLIEKAAPAIEITEAPLHAIPLYNQDEDGERMPTTVRQFKQAIAECQGLVIVSPEYNHGISGVLKNALDWASRPAFASPIMGKVVVLMTCSPGFLGGVRAQAQLHLTVTSMLAHVATHPQVVIGAAASKMKDGRLTDQASLDVAMAALQAGAAEIRLRRRGPTGSSP